MTNILATLAFFAHYPGWQTVGKHRGTKNAVKSLVKHGYLEANEFSQARFTGKVFSNNYVPALPQARD